MFKLLLILAIGVAIGYGYGWRDAQTHDKHIAERLLERAGGDSRALVAADFDKKMHDAEKH